MKRLLFAGLLMLGLTSAARAQTSFVSISLLNEKLDQSGGAWRVSEVLDVRPSRHLGMVRAGLANRLVPAVLAQPLTTEVLTLLNQAPPAPGARPVVLRVLALGVDERIQGLSEFSQAELVADFLEPVSDSTYRVVLTVAETLQGKAFDVTSQHGANIATLLRTALFRLNTQPPAPTAELLSRTAVRAGQGGAGALRYVVQLNPAPAPRGVYRSLAEFRDHAPGGAWEFQLKAPSHPMPRQLLTGEVWAAYLDAAGPASRPRLRDVWGLSDGQRDYICYEGAFYPVQLSADRHSLRFLGPPQINPEKNASVASAWALGGIAAASNVRRDYAPDPVASPYEVHLATGRVLPLSDQQLTASAPASSSPDSTIAYVFRPADPAHPQAWSLRLNGRAAGTLLPQSYVRLAWAGPRELPVCVQPPGAASACRPCLAAPGQPFYLEASAPAGAAPALMPLTAAEARLRLEQLGRQKK